VVFQSYVPYEVYEVPLILRNKDKVSAVMRRFTTVLEEENSVIHVVYSIARYLLQHSAPGMECLVTFILQNHRIIE